MRAALFSLSTLVVLSGQQCAVPDPLAGVGGFVPNVDLLRSLDNGDPCAAEGWYGDGVCDPDCPQPDPDCADPCALNGWYGDGVCDSDCPQPDPDCTSP